MIFIGIIISLVFGSCSNNSLNTNEASALLNNICNNYPRTVNMSKIYFFELYSTTKLRSNAFNFSHTINIVGVDSQELIKKLENYNLIAAISQHKARGLLTDNHPYYKVLFSDAAKKFIKREYEVGGFLVQDEVAELIVSKRIFIKVTNVSKPYIYDGKNECEVEFLFQNNDITPFGKIFLEKMKSENIKGIALFVSYADGWHVKRIHYKDNDEIVSLPKN